MRRNHPIRLGIILSISLAGAGWAQPALEPEQAGPDFKIQGEYLGHASLPGSSTTTWGAQVIALGGKGDFRAVLLAGGLPGGGWDGKTQKVLSGKVSGGQASFTATGLTAIVKASGDSLVLQSGTGARYALAKVFRQSPTLGRKAPSTAQVLFDGSGAVAWQKGQVDDRGFLRGGTQSVKRFQDFQLHLEFRIPFTPEVLYRNRGNSGVFLQGRFELQIYDSFGWQVPFDTAFYRTYAIEPWGSCGSFYGVEAPMVNMSYPPLAWQTYDIRFQAARFDGTGRMLAPALVSVEHNGVPIHAGTLLPTTTVEAILPMNKEPGPILLQEHGSPVFFRNIWIDESVQPSGIRVRKTRGISPTAWRSGGLRFDAAGRRRRGP